MQILTAEVTERHSDMGYMQQDSQIHCK